MYSYFRSTCAFLIYLRIFLYYMYILYLNMFNAFNRSFVPILGNVKEIERVNSHKLNSRLINYFPSSILLINASIWFILLFSSEIKRHSLCVYNNNISIHRNIIYINIIYKIGHRNALKLNNIVLQLSKRTKIYLTYLHD